MRGGGAGLGSPGCNTARTPAASRKVRTTRSSRSGSAVSHARTHAVSGWSRAQVQPGATDDRGGESRPDEHCESEKVRVGHAHSVVRDEARSIAGR
jgi:hypothetical protein